MAGSCGYGGGSRLCSPAQKTYNSTKHIDLLLTNKQQYALLHKPCSSIAALNTVMWADLPAYVMKLTCATWCAIQVPAHVSAPRSGGDEEDDADSSDSDESMTGGGAGAVQPRKRPVSAGSESKPGKKGRFSKKAAASLNGSPPAEKKQGPVFGYLQPLLGDRTVFSAVYVAIVDTQLYICAQSYVHMHTVACSQPERPLRLWAQVDDTPS